MGEAQPRSVQLEDLRVECLGEPCIGGRSERRVHEVRGRLGESRHHARDLERRRGKAVESLA